MIPILTIIVLIALDQLTKYIAFTKLQPIHKIVLIDGFFNLTYIENRGAAFGALQGARWFFVILAALVIIVGCVYYAKMPKTQKTLLLRISMLLIGGGTIGNVIDRLFRTYVVDFLDFIIFGYDFPVFNLADIFIVVGTGLLMIYILRWETERNK
ncbi:MAG: signal peptidase II [Firmicutes bacterium]|nr:signal peptidase II [Bacillota bacterium]MBQ9605428.1 signal peptidase II [Bacillota bacterium]